MANTTQDVELRIRATDYSKQGTDKVVDALKELTKTQDAQIESAKQSTKAASALEAQYTKIESAIKALISQSALIKLFESQSKAATDAAARMEDARKRLTDYQNALDPAAKKTKEQSAELAKLTRALSGAEKSYASIQSRIAGTTERLAAFGITTDNLAASQAKIANAVTAGNAALARQEAAINDLAGAEARARIEAQRQVEQKEKLAAINARIAVAQDALRRKTEAEREAHAAAARVIADEQRARLASLNATIALAQQRNAETEAINKKTAALNAQNAALRQAADAAERLARSSEVTARGTRAAPAQSVASTIRDIQDPAAAALRSVSGLDAAIASLESRVAAINGPVKNYRQTLQDATNAQRALTVVAGQIDAYNRQIAAVRAARTEYVAARNAVNQLVAEMRSGAAGEDVTTRMARAQSTLRGAATQMGNLTTEARAARAALQALGVDTSNLAQAEQNLVAQANRATTAMNGLTQAFRQNGAAVENNRTFYERWFGTGRTTLSFMQRIRGELLGIGAGFVGVNAAIGLSQSVVEAYNTKQSIMNRLLATTNGNMREAVKEYDYLHEAANRIGVDFEKIAPAYAKFAIAGKAAGFSTEGLHFMFEQLAGSAAKLNFSVDDTQGVFRAFEQMMSKGVIQSEELRQQLGDRLPGALQIAAREAKMTTAEYMRLMSENQIGSERVIQIARGMGKTFGVTGEATDTVRAAQARYNNALFDFKQTMADSGFIDAYTGALVKLTEAFKGDDGKKFAEQLGQAFADVAKVIGFLADNLTLVKNTIIAIMALNVVAWLTSLPMLIRNVGAAIRDVNALIIAFQGYLASAAAANALSGALGASGLTGVMVGLRGALIAVANAALFAATRLLPLVALGAAAYAATSFVLDKTEDKYREHYRDTAAAANKAHSDAIRAQAAADAAKGTQQEKALRAEADRQRNAYAAAIKAQEKAAKEVKDRGIEMSKDMMPRVSVGRAPAADPGDMPEDIAARMGNMLRDEIKKAESASREARLKMAKDNLAARLKIVDEEFKDEREAVAKSTATAENKAKALEAIQKASLLRQQAERERFESERMTSGESAVKRRAKLEEEIRTMLAAAQDDVKKREEELGATSENYDARRLARQTAIGHSYDNIAKKIKEVLRLNSKEAATFDEQYRKLKEQRVTQEGVLSDRDQAARLEKEFNDLLEIQKTRLSEVNREYAAGVITLEQQRDALNEIAIEMGPAIDDAGDRALAFAEKVRKFLDPVVYQKLVASIKTGLAGANAAATVATNNAATAQTKLNTELSNMQFELQAIDAQRKAGLIDSEQQAASINNTMDRYKQKILDAANAYLTLIEAQYASGQMSEENYLKIKQSTEMLIMNTQVATRAFSDMDETIASSILQNGVTAFQTLGEEIGKVVMGTQSLGEGFKGALRAAGQFFASLLRDIAQAIAKQLILRAISGFMGPGGGIGAAAASMVAGGQHNGGIAGLNATFKRRVDSSIFNGAPKYHTGGIAGLAPNEVPAILQRNEEVLTRDDPRHVLNGGKSGASSDQGVRFVLVDDRSKVAEAMQSAEGEKVIMQNLRRNIPTLKSWLK